MKKITDIIFSLKLSVVLLFLVGIGSAVATFVENDFGNESARALVYNAFWFEAVIVLAAINMTGTIYRYRMWKKEKLAMFVFHLSFVIIILGAGITRFLGYEGSMHIREGEASSKIVSDNTYLMITARKGEETDSYTDNVLFSPLTSNSFSKTLVAGGDVKVRLLQYYHRAEQRIIPSPDGRGETFIQMMITGTGGKGDNVTLSPGAFRKQGDVRFSFDAGGVEEALPVVFITSKFGELRMRPSLPVTWMKMADKSRGRLSPGVFHPLEKGKLFTMNGVSFVVKDIMHNAVRRLVPVDSKRGPSGLVFDVSYNGKSKMVEISGMKGSAAEPTSVSFEDGTTVELAYGSRVISLPFSLHLKDFVMARYPGSDTPSSYESHVIVIDREQGVEIPYHIYMNHILVHRGFRFYQSSYDRDEKGTILSVAHDPGKIPTYIGYILMSLGFLMAPFSSGGRFRRLSKMIDRDRLAQSVQLALGAILISGLSLFQPGELSAQQLPPGVDYVSAAHAEKFGHIVVHDVKGRIKPVDTLSSEVLNKTMHSSERFGLTHNQIVLSMIADPGTWQSVPLIKITNPGVKLFLKMGMNENYAPFTSFFNYETDNEYRLLKASEEAQRAAPSMRTKLDKAIIKADEKANITYMLYRGDLFRLFPLPQDPQNRWHSIIDEDKIADPIVLAQTKELWTSYLGSVKVAMRSGDYSQADAKLEEIAKYQRENAVAEHLPSEAVLNSEILFNKLNIFDRLTAVYLSLGFFLLALVFARIIKPSLNVSRVMLLASAIIAAGFAAHTFGLGLRWYVSGHAPWSNGYESLIYISWATILAGFVFARKSSFSLSATSIVAGLALLVAHLSWMDPQITNLVPVLKSYWLTIHVSIISASYGFLALSALLGFISLVLFSFRKREGRPQVDHAIMEMVRINEMSMMIGLAFLSIGNILGAVWANESWGRYWSWDPKETWTLISMVVYAALLHFRFIPGLKGVFPMAVGSLLTFSSVLMTYFGVNYYLTGMHSYAAGDPVPVPAFLYYAIVIITIVIFLAARKRDGKFPVKIS